MIYLFALSPQLTTGYHLPYIQLMRVKLYPYYTYGIFFNRDYQVCVCFVTEGAYIEKLMFYCSYNL